MKERLTVVPRKKNMHKRQLQEKVEAGLLPVILTGKNIDPIYGFLLSLEVNMGEVETGQIFDLDFGGEILRAQFQNRTSGPSGLRDYRFEIVDEWDFAEARVPLVIDGTSLGEKKGANLYIAKSELLVRGRREDIPPRLELDVSSVDVNQKVYIKDLQLPPGIACRPNLARELVLECKFKHEDATLLDAFQQSWMQAAM